jgi:hypothetical protein
MNEQQRLWLVQARSDYRMFNELRHHSVPICHILHYLQMSAEKLAKAYFWRTGNPRISHAVLLKFFRAIKSNDRVRAAFRCGQRDAWKAMIDGISQVAFTVERLAPDLSGDGPNPEYPWPPALPTMAPAEFTFPLWTGPGADAPMRKFLQFLDVLFTRAEACF